MRHSSTTLYILAAAGVYGSTHEYEDHEINANASSAGHNHPYVGLPIGTWRITDFNSSRREEICSSQQDFCVNKCENQVRTNYCNTTTMAWICLCQSHVPDVPPYHWPVTLAECQGKEQACMNNCFYGSTKTICIDACSRYYTCDKAGSPFSGLRVEREDQTPTYGNSSSSSSYSFNRYICAIYFFVYYFIYSYM